MAKWFVAAKKADFNKIAETFGISPVLARIIRNRDLVEEAEIRKFLSGTPEEMYEPRLLLGMEEAALLMEKKIREQARIRVIGDYDVDGICSSFILKKGIQCAGGVVDTVIPHRMKDGYGLNEALVEEAAKDGIDTIVTCDNGIAAAAQIELAKTLGMTVIVTDHHEVPYEEKEDGTRLFLLPPADVVVDPKQEGDGYPFREICGAVVAYKLIQQLYGQMGIAEKRSDVTEELMEFAAFATICDVMPLKDENRILVRYGLEKMQRTRNEGLRALMEVNGLEQKKLGAFHIGFVLGPCLNASGRLDTAARALQLLEAGTRSEAVRLAAELKQLNDSRKELTEQFVKKAVALIESSPVCQDRVLVVYLPDCHESIAGIIAGRLRERYYKPVFVLTRGEEGVKGSARSIETYHIYEEMTRCRELFTKYGGHKMAAGLSMEEKNVEPFRQKINAICTLTEEDMEERVHIDVPMPVSYVTRAFVEELEKLEPFGTGNPKPVFAQKQLRFLSARVLGKAGNAMRFSVQDDTGALWEMMYFGSREQLEAYVEKKAGKEQLEALYCGRGCRLCMDVTYYPGLNTYQGNTRLQLVMQQYQ